MSVSTKSLLRSSLILFFFSALRESLAIVIYSSARSPIDIRHSLKQSTITRTFFTADILSADITDIADIADIADITDIAGIAGILLTPTSLSSWGSM